MGHLCFKGRVFVCAGGGGSLISRLAKLDVHTIFREALSLTAAVLKYFALGKNIMLERYILFI